MWIGGGVGREVNEEGVDAALVILEVEYGGGTFWVRKGVTRVEASHDKEDSQLKGCLLIKDHDEPPSTTATTPVSRSAAATDPYVSQQNERISIEHEVRTASLSGSSGCQSTEVNLVAERESAVISCLRYQ
jgi:hypothetical protein